MVSKNSVETASLLLRPSCRLCFALDEEPDLFDDFLDNSYSDAAREVAVLSDYTPLVPGHLLIVSRGHHKSVGSLGSSRSIESVAAVLNCIRNRYESSGLYVIAFEHGPHRYGEAGSCIDHAHVHVVPCAKEVYVTDISLSPFLRSVGLGDWRRLEDFNSLRRLASKVSYLWIQDTSRNSAITVVGEKCFLPSQALRCWCAEVLNLGHWDWRSNLGRGQAHNDTAPIVGSDFDIMRS
jgi:diadenosine tetraphosphate (Ap4A) HIT family hydrolase